MTREQVGQFILWRVPHGVDCPHFTLGWGGRRRRGGGWYWRNHWEGSRRVGGIYHRRQIRFAPARQQVNQRQNAHYPNRAQDDVHTDPESLLGQPSKGLPGHPARGRFRRCIWFNRRRRLGDGGAQRGQTRVSSGSMAEQLGQKIIG